MSKTETQSEALRLAEMLEKGPRRQGDVRIAAVLRGLDAENKALWERLEIDPSHPIDGIEARDETIRQLDAQNKALRIKAARYDYIKQFGTSGETEALTHPRQVVYASIGFHGHELGAAIDARIAEKAAAKNGGAA